MKRALRLQLLAATIVSPREQDQDCPLITEENVAGVIRAQAEAGLRGAS